jgi:hypothetical protein
MSKITSIRARLSAMAAMAGGLAWIVVGVLQLTGGDEFTTSAVETVADHAMMGFLAAALVLTAPAMLALAGHARTQRPGYLAVIGQVLLAIAATTSNIVGDDPVFFAVVAPLANAMWLCGAIALAVSLKRAGEVPNAVVYGLPLVQVFALPLSVIGGPVVSGGYWLAVASLPALDGLPRRSPHPETARPPQLRLKGITTMTKQLLALVAGFTALVALGLAGTAAAAPRLNAINWQNLPAEAHPPSRRASSSSIAATHSTSSDSSELPNVIRADGYHLPHAVGTCSMGPRREDGAVVDTSGGVHGTEHLPVIDASIVPNGLSGFTHIPTSCSPSACPNSRRRTLTRP